MTNAQRYFMVLGLEVGCGGIGYTLKSIVDGGSLHWSFVPSLVLGVACGIVLWKLVRVQPSRPGISS